MKKLFASSLLTTAFALAACAGSAPEGVESTGLVIDRHDDSVVAGSFEAADGLVSFRAEMPRLHVGTLRVDVGEATLFLSNDSDVGEVLVDGKDTVLTGADRAALLEFSRAVDAYVGEVRDPAVMHESMLSAGAAYFAVAPVGMAIEAFAQPVPSLSKDASSYYGDDGKVCITVGSWYYAYFDGQYGSHRQTWQAGANGGVTSSGDYGCMGRCGPACGGGDWTIDCLEHDACSRGYGASGGGNDSNCGDEWYDASDDYTNIFKRCYN